MGELRLLAHGRIIGRVAFADPAGKRVGVGKRDPSDQFFSVEALPAEPLAKTIEQFWMRWGVVFAEIVDRPGETVAEEVAPDPVHSSLGHQRAVDDELSQRLATVDAILRAIVHLRREVAGGINGRPVDENRIGDFHLPVAEFVVKLGLGGVAPLAGPILINEFDCLNVTGPLELPQRPHLTEEGVELPKLVLLSLVKGMVVALRALHLEAEKHLSCLGGGLNAIVLKFP